jgi:hypothetical protein
MACELQRLTANIETVIFIFGENFIIFSYVGIVNQHKVLFVGFMNNLGVKSNNSTKEINLKRKVLIEAFK